MNLRRRKAVISIVSAVAALAAGCGGGGGGSTSTTGAVSQSIGSSGGSISNGNLTATVPPNAVSTPTTITITPTTSVPAPPCGGVMVGTGAFVFDTPSVNQPINLSVTYTSSSAAALPRNTQLYVAELTNGDWQLLPTTLSTTTSLATAPIDGSGTFALIAAPASDGAGSTCTPCSDSTSTTGGSSTGGSTGSSSPPAPPITTGSTSTGSTTTGSSSPPSPPFSTGSTTTGSTTTGSSSLPPPPPISN